MTIRRGWTWQVLATALLVVACGAVGTAVAATGGDTPSAVALAGR